MRLPTRSWKQFLHSLNGGGGGNQIHVSAAVSSPSIDEGGSVTINGTISGVPLEYLTGASVTVNGQSCTVGVDGSFSTTMTFLDDDPTNTSSDSVDLTVVAVDNQGHSASTVVTVTINNVAPTLNNVSLSSSAIDEGGDVTVSGTIGDVGMFDTFTLTVDWGGGSTDTQTFSAIYYAGVPSFSFSHHFADDNPTHTSSDQMTINVNVTDDDNSTAAQGLSLTVNHVTPTITGGGDIGTFYKCDHTVAENDFNPSITDPGADTFTTHVAGISNAAGFHSVDVYVTDDDTGESNHLSYTYTILACGYWQEQTADNTTDDPTGNTSDNDVAVNDVYTVTSGQVLSIIPSGILSNDTASLSIEYHRYGTIQHHWVWVDDDNGGGTGGSNYTDPNNPPQDWDETIDDHYWQDEPVNMTAMLVGSPPDYEEFNLASDGSLVFKPSAGASGLQSFTYYVSAGGASSNIATVILDVTNLSLKLNGDQNLNVDGVDYVFTDSNPDGDNRNPLAVEALSLNNPDGEILRGYHLIIHHGASITVFATSNKLNTIDDGTDYEIGDGDLYGTKEDDGQTWRTMSLVRPVGTTPIVALIQNADLTKVQAFTAKSTFTVAPQIQEQPFSLPTPREDGDEAVFSILRQSAEHVMKDSP